MVIRDGLNVTVLDRWIGRKEPDDRASFEWSSCSHDLIPCDICLWGFINDCVYVPPLPSDLPDLRNRMEAAVATITPDTLIKVWEELDYRCDVCRVTMELTLNTFKLLWQSLSEDLQSNWCTRRYDTAGSRCGGHIRVQSQVGTPDVTCLYHNGLSQDWLRLTTQSVNSAQAYFSVAAVPSNRPESIESVADWSIDSNEDEYVFV
ncbi:hypothetical protein J6590_003306 [Homalodisca vitripennis]|nr:hypothetical protein J6590_003306 [Homalodisca vitripennis]